MPLTDLARSWSTATYTNSAVRLSASETDNSGWKKFYSVESSQDPYVSFTYNRKPNAAATPTVGAPANTFVAPGSGSGQIFTSDTTPTFTSAATDPDGSQVRVTFEVHKDTTGTTKVSTCETALVSSGAATSCTPATALAENGAQPAWYVRAAVRDERGLWNGTWSPWQKFFVVTSAPPAATVSCDRGYDAGVWTDTDPAGVVTCQVRAAGVAGTLRAPGYLDVTIDGVVKPRLTITPTDDTSVVQATYTFPASARGYHEVKVIPVGRSLRTGPVATYGFGWGSAALSRPGVGTASSGTIRVEATGAPRGSASYVSARVQWRVAGSGNESTGWTDAAAGPSNITPGSPSAPARYAANFDLTGAIREAGRPADLPSRIPVRLDVQVCFTYTGTGASTQCTWSESPVTVTRLPHAFGAGYPVTDAGIGQLAQYTGEVSLSATDVSVPGYTGDISLSRSHTSFAGDGSIASWPSDPVTGVFGPGFTANLDGGEAGLAGLQLVDNTGLDGSIAFLDGQGEPLVYVNPAGTRTYPASGTEYVAGTDETLAAGTRLTITGSGTATVLTLTEQDGTTTTWEPTSAPSPATPTIWRPATISQPGQAGKTTFGHDPATGRVTRIVAPVPDGMAGTSCPTSGTLAKGCRALDVTYATVTTATSTSPGDYAGQVASISSQLWDPATSAMATTVVATYTYDTSGRLRSVTDPRSGLTTSYTWTGATTRLASVAGDGLAATDLSYDAAGRLTQVSRQAPQTGGPDVVTHRFVYDVPTSGTGLPDVHDAVTDYRQKAAPVTGFAAFGQDYTGPVTDPGVDWTYADLSYVDDLGYTVNTATYGAGQWLITSADFDDHDNVTRALDASAAATARANPDWDTPQVDTLATQTLYNTEEKNAAGDIILPDGSRVTDTFAPSRTVTLASGQQVPARPHTRTVYDQGAPNGGINPATGQRYSLPTTVTAGVSDGTATPDAADLEVYSTTVSDYNKLNASDASDATEGDGWALGTPTRTTTKGATSGDDITKVTRYDTMGRVTETRQPLSTGTDAGTTMTAYYTVAAQPAPNATCGGKPEWAGLVCRTYPAAQPAGQPLPDQVTTAYSMWLRPVTQVATSGAATRTTTTGYDAAGRQISSKTTASGITGSVPHAGSYTKYDPSTGLVAYTGWLNATGDDADTAGRTTTSYDRWGRTVTQVGDAGTVTTSYDSAGRVQSVTDAKGTTTYGYDGTDSGGAGERRGLVTSMTVTRGGTAGTLTYQAEYDADGNLTRQTLPGRITQVASFDEGGQLVGLQYLGQVTPVTVVEDPVTHEISYVPGTPVQDQPWLTWTLGRDGAGRIRYEQTGSGAAYDNGDGVSTINDVADWTAAVGQASSYQREYRYDYAGRLTVAQDAASAPAAATPTASCTTRAYGFDKNGRRTSLATTTRTGADCAATGTTVTTPAGGYDTADRPVAGVGGVGGYVYDQFGRQTTIPATDAPDPAGGAITLAYFDDDLPKTVAQGGTSTTFTLDAAGRRSVQTTTDASGTTTITRRYTGGTDNPAWIDTTGPVGATTTRFTQAIGADLSASIVPDGGVTLSLADPHGDVVTTVDIPAAQADATPVVGIDGWVDYTEYGNPAATSSAAAIAAVAGVVGYGWLGAKQRSTTGATAGLTLMGVRLYNPATGGFTSPDPVPGGNTTAYTYPQDPINAYDLDGLCWAGFSWACTAAKAIGNAATSVAKTAWKHRSQIVHAAIGFGASAIAGAVAVGICGATAGIGCVVVAGVMTRVAIGAVAHPVADRVLGHRTTGRDVLSYAIKDALGGGGAGFLNGAYGRGALGIAMARLKGQAAAKPGFGGLKAMFGRNPWAHSR
jgi:RHS repeat-associated protein